MRLTGNTSKLLIFVVIIVFIESCTSAAKKNDQNLKSELPDDLEWYESYNGVGTFLKPKSWFVREKKNGQTSALFISRENLDINGRFIAGLTVYKIQWDSSKMSPSEYAEKYIDEIKSNKKYTVIKSGILKTKAGDMNTALIGGYNGPVKSIAKHGAIGIDAQKLLFLIIASAPANEWDSLYHPLGTMLNGFAIGVSPR